MPRLVALLFIGLVLVPAVAGPEVAPAPRVKVHVAPPPRLPGEPLVLDLTNEDIGLDPAIEAALPKLDRIDDVTIPGPPLPDVPLGIVGLPDRLKVPGGIGQPDPPMPLPSFSRPGGPTKVQLLREAGGNAESERAVALGLAWLARQQKADGSWVFDGADKNEVATATAMALLAFHGAGETHKDGKKYQKSVNAGLQWLIKDQTANGPNAGKFKSIGSMYSQGIATLALVEAYALTKDKELLAPAQAAINYIQKAQGANGSWGYSAGANGDTSITGWQIQALEAAKRAGLDVDDKLIKKTIQFLDSAAGGPRKSVYGYNDKAGAAPGTALTAVGLWCRIHIDGWDAKNAGLIDGVEGLLKRGPAKDGKQPDVYFMHYATQVMRKFGGEEWQTWNEGPKQNDGTRKGGLRDTLVSLQIKKDGMTMGSWDPDNGFIGRSCGRHGTTALNILALEVYYRNLPPKP